MRDLTDILAAFDALSAAGKPAALATVIAVDGSAYRRPGARMLVAEDGRTWGGVSGGCLERDVARRARGVIATGRPLRCRYDTADDGELAPAAATGCGGAVELFVQPLAPDRPGPLRLLAQSIRDRQPVSLSTTVAATGSLAGSVGSCLALADHDLPPAADDGPRPDRPRLITCTTDAGSAELFVEHVTPPLPLVVFGAGPDAVPLVAIARTLGWHVTVVGSHPATGAAQRFAAADVLVVTGPDDPAAGVPIPPDAAVVLMTHNVARDAQVLRALPAPVRYLGVLGPRHRTDRLLADLPPDSPVFRSALFAPVGLDLAAETPEQIALAITAEVQRVTRGGTGRSLADLPGPIHARPAGALPADLAADRRAACPA